MKDETLPKTLILKSKKEFEEIFEKGSRKSSGNLTIYCYTSDRPEIKFGFLTDKRIKKSVSRNKLKRWLREIVRKNKEKFSSGQKIIFFAKKEALDKTYWDLYADFEKLYNTR